MTSIILTAITRYLFDTSVFIDYLRGRASATDIMNQARLRPTPIAIGYSIITITELWVGITGSRTISEHENILHGFDCYLMTIPIAKRAGELQRPYIKANEPSVEDCIIAATAEHYGLTICTRNKKHFELFKTVSLEVYA